MQTSSTTPDSAQGFRALADPTRLQVLELVANGERCVCELTAALDIPQPLLSHHLKTLREAGFITARKEGRWMYYALNRERLEACVCALNDTLDTYDEAAKRGAPGCACGS